jgi:hypothetical protein
MKLFQNQIFTSNEGLLNLNGCLIIIHKKLVNELNIIIVHKDESIYQGTTLINVNNNSK